MTAKKGNYEESIEYLNNSLDVMKRSKYSEKVDQAKVLNKRAKI
jgi:hypothetical protein